MDDFSLRFLNWHRWCVQKSLYQGHAGSVEGRYRSPQANHWDPPGPRPPAIDVLDALAVNRAYTRLAVLSPRNANIIKILTFRAHWRPQWQAQKLGIHYLKLDEALHKAKIMLFNQVKMVRRVSR